MSSRSFFVADTSRCSVCGMSIQVSQALKPRSVEKRCPSVVIKSPLYHSGILRAEFNLELSRKLMGCPDSSNLLPRSIPLIIHLVVRRRSRQTKLRLATSWAPLCSAPQSFFRGLRHCCVVSRCTDCISRASFLVWQSPLLLSDGAITLSGLLLDVFGRFGSRTFLFGLLLRT
jgi:hypothetical protein